MSKSVGITISSFSYTPEAYAYKDYLENLGVSVQLSNMNELDPLNDVNIFFMGFKPFRKVQGSVKEIHEYHSLSTPKFARLKDFIKSKGNCKPDGRIFLNELVKKKMSFSDTVSYIYRDMGVDDAMFQRPNKNPKYDIVYCGSISGRSGVVEEIIRLSNYGFKMLVIGSVSDENKTLFLENSKNIELAGRVERKQLPSLFRECKAGLNYTPDIYPFNMQTSTKTLEYLAAGLNLISNNYFWIEKFSSECELNPIWCDDITSYFEMGVSEKILPQEDFSWNHILEKNCFYDFIFS